jgi:hypothetical protein
MRNLFVGVYFWKAPKLSKIGFRPLLCHFERSRIPAKPGTLRSRETLRFLNTAQNKAPIGL